MLVLTMKENDVVVIGNVVIAFEHRDGSFYDLLIDAPKSMVIAREKIFTPEQREKAGPVLEMAAKNKRRKGGG